MRARKTVRVYVMYLSKGLHKHNLRQQIRGTNLTFTEYFLAVQQITYPVTNLPYWQV